MIVVKIILKVVCMPILLILTLIKWIGVFITAMSSVFFYLLAFVFFITGVLSYGFGLDSSKECIRVLATAFFVFMLPVVGTWIVAGIGALQSLLLEIIWS